MNSSLVKQMVYDWEGLLPPILWSPAILGASPLMASSETPLSYPPAMRWIRDRRDAKASTARTVASGVVDLESLKNRGG